MDLLAETARSDAIEGFGVTIHVASIDDLILMKTAANRPKDQAHILELLALKSLTGQG